MSVFLFPNRIKDTDFSVTRQVIALLDQHGIHALLADELAGELVDTKAVFLPQQQAFLSFIKNTPKYAHWLPLFTFMLGTG